MNSSSMGESEHINIKRNTRKEDFLSPRPYIDSPLLKQKKRSILKSPAEANEISKFGSNDKIIK